MRLFAAVLAFVCVIPAAAAGAPYVSNSYGFTADFPDTPAVGEPKGSETNDQGKFIANSVQIKTEVPGVYTAMVTVETYTIPTKIDAGSLVAMTKMFAAELDAKLSSAKAGKLDGYRARFFSYESSDHKAAGKGVVVLVPGKKPRVYMIISMHTPMASDEEVADLDKFVASFHLN